MELLQAGGLLPKLPWENSQLGAAVKLQPHQTRKQLHPWRSGFPLFLCRSSILSPFLTGCCCYFFFNNNKGPLLPIGHILDDQRFKLGESNCLCRSGITNPKANKFGPNLGDCSGSLDPQKFQVWELPDWREMNTIFTIHEFQVLQ
ncbi:unnamed protein product [Urochloa humidicola]